MALYHLTPVVGFRVVLVENGIDKPLSALFSGPSSERDAEKARRKILRLSGDRSCYSKNRYLHVRQVTEFLPV